jgi:hypothetical protein
MKKSKTIIYLIALLLFSAIYYFIQRNGTDFSDVNHQITHNLPTKYIKINHEFNVTEDEGKIDDIKGKITSESDVRTLKKLNYVCNKNENHLKRPITKNLKHNKLTKLQILAKNKILSICDNWNDYLDSLSYEQLELLKLNNKEIGELNNYFNTFKPYSKEMLNEARQYISSNDQEPVAMLTIGALANLLSQDFEFMHKVVDKLGIKDISYLANHNYDIATLYYCEIEPLSCSANSIDTLSLCIDFEDRCGLSYSEYFATTVTPNQFSDYMNTIDIIMSLIKEGFFSQDI